MRRLLASLSAVILTLAVAHDARASMPLLTGLGGTNGFGTGCMPPNDDGTWPYTGALDITAAFPNGLHFFGGTYKSVYINNNGNISFSGSLSTYTPTAFPGAPQAMIAPYWADVDTRTTSGADTCDSEDYPGGGSYPATATCAATPPTTNLVQWSITPGQFVVTWYEVGYFSCHVTPYMSFQLILTAADVCGGVSTATDFDIEFRYNTCGWEAGDASGGSNGFCPTSGGIGACVPAQAGFDPGLALPDTGYASLPKSRQAGISTELCTQSNLSPAVPGDWKFTVIGGAIQCPTAGQPCQTGMPGVCADGQLQCSVAGTGADGGVSCVPLIPPGPTQCNGLDNDCNGVIDTGPCPTGTVCNGTACVPICIEGGCQAGQTCSQGLCIETDCLNVTCPTGERCVAGSCVDACTGVTCPIGQICRLGNCVDPCANLDCGKGQVCESGLCVPACPCTACDGGTTCEVDAGVLSGHCVATDCASVTCPTGQVCQSGGCIDACTGAHCPASETCTGGQCVPGTASEDAGGGGGVVLQGDDGGFGGLDDGGFVFDATLGDDGGAGSYFTGRPKSGCGCTTAGANGTSKTPLWLSAVGLGLAAITGRRRRRGQRSRA